MRDITALHPELQEKLKVLQTKCKNAGLKIGIGECVRTIAEQDKLYAQGRTSPGSIVTNAKGSRYQSMHQWGVAFDFYRNDGKGAFYNKDGFFQKVGKIGQSIGLEWGGSWTSPVDLPHFQLKQWGSTASKLKSQYGTPDNFKKSWTKSQWIQDSVGWWYKHSDGTYTKNGWEYINGVWYYFDERGYALCNCFKLINGYWYYFNADCAMQTGWVKYKGKWCYCRTSKEGIYPEGSSVMSGWIKYNGKDYYMDKDGYMAEYCYVKSTVKNLYYWLNKDGVYEPQWDTSRPDLKKYRLVV